MPSDLAAYLLLAMNLLVVAVVLAVPVLAVWWLVGRRRRLPDPPPEPLADVDVPPGERVLRRCDDCDGLWKGSPAEDAGALRLRLRRWVRRRTRARRGPTPAWARRRGWNRCPSCLSTNVRTSSARRIRA